MLEIETLAQFHDWAVQQSHGEPAIQEDAVRAAAVAGTGSGAAPFGVIFQGLDLSGEQDRLRGLPRVSLESAVFLGCELPDAFLSRLYRVGALVFPRPVGLPYHPYRSGLYTAPELLHGYEPGRWESREQMLDALIYRHFQNHRGETSLLEALTQRLHDHAIDDALQDFLGIQRASSELSSEPRGSRSPRWKVVAIMGGHAMLRTEPRYREVVLLAREICRRDLQILIATGGGPGAMEAGHLGAWLAEESLEAVDVALQTLSSAPSYRDEGWFDTALDVRELFRSPRPSLGIPTWFYGHEPPNIFATNIAKYFSNSLREDGLLAIAQHGVIYAPGSAGTVQEVFMDAAQNHYGTFDLVSPMIFLGKDYWRREKPVASLLEPLARGRQYSNLIAYADGFEEAADFLMQNPPVRFLSQV